MLHNQEVMGSYPALCKYLSLLFCPLSSESLVQVPQRGTILIDFLQNQVLLYSRG